MAKIPFDIKFKPQIESGKYKVVTEDDEPARIICWDSTINKERPIIAIVFDDQIEQYKANGRYDNDYDTSNYDLFIVTPEPELSEFEKAVAKYRPQSDTKETIQRIASELLACARKELKPEIKAEALKDLQENLANNDIYRVPESLREVLVMAKNNGKKEALKDLPRWIPNKFDKHNFETCKAYLDTPRYLCYQDRMIDVSELVKKLPGFNEDEK